MNANAFSILLVDDDPAVLRIIKVYLQRAGYTIRTAHDGQEAWEQICRECPDVLITDWMMPQMTGLELIRKTREAKLPHFMYVLLLTARHQQEDIIEALEAGTNDFVPKPVSAAELMARLRAGLRIVELERNLRQLSECDALTGILNRRSFHTQLVREWTRAERYALPLAAVILDVDFFKKVNDEYGHPAGDAVLVTVAALLREHCRPCDYVCRFGGEEFVVLLPQTDELGAAAWAERMRVILSETSIPCGEKTLRVTASFGVAEKLSETGNPEILIDWADQCLLVAKRTGRDRVICNSQLNDPLQDPFGGGGDDHPLDGALARDIMSTLVMCLNKNDGILQAVELVLQLRLASVPVVDDDGQLVGIISEKDLMMLDAGHAGWNQTVGDVMKTNVVAYDENTTAKEIFDFLCRVAIRRVVVVSQSQPVGMISRDTFLRWNVNWITAHRAAEFSELAAADPESRCRDEIIRAAETLKRHGQALIDQLQTSPCVAEAIPAIVGGATRMQDLVNDLLGHCRQTLVS